VQARIQQIDESWRSSSATLREQTACWFQIQETGGPVGKILAAAAPKYGCERSEVRLTNDALVATSAARNGITVISTNSRDSALLAKFCKPGFLWSSRLVSDFTEILPGRRNPLAPGVNVSRGLEWPPAAA